LFYAHQLHTTSCASPCHKCIQSSVIAVFAGKTKSCRVAVCSPQEVLASAPVAPVTTKLECAKLADGAAALVLVPATAAAGSQHSRGEGPWLGRGDGRQSGSGKPLMITLNACFGMPPAAMHLQSPTAPLRSTLLALAQNGTPCSLSTDGDCQLGLQPSHS
jgi:hypothetical protein